MKPLYFPNGFTVFVLGSFLHLEYISMIELRQHLTFLKTDSRLSEHSRMDRLLPPFSAALKCGFLSTEALLLDSFKAPGLFWFCFGFFVVVVVFN